MRTHGRALALVALVATAGGCIYDVSRFRNPADGGAADGDAAADVAFEAGDAAHDGGVETGVDADASVDVEASLDAAFDVNADAPSEVGPDAEAGTDATIETGLDVPVLDAPVETGPDVLDEGASDASPDALFETGSEGGSCVPGVGADARPPDPSDAAAEPCSPGQTRPCYPGPAGTQNVGVCHSGLEWCVATNVWSGECFGSVTPAQGDLCGNSADDDCDGTPEQDCPGVCTERMEACTTGPERFRGTGRCRRGTRTCVEPELGGDSVERCTTPGPNALDLCGNGEDDDCDGVVDDGCEGYLPTEYSAVINPSGARSDDACGGMHAEILRGADDEVAVFPGPADSFVMPFPIRFYGRLVPPVLVISSNGWLSFGEDASHTVDQREVSSPYGMSGARSRPNNVIAPYWADLTLGTHGVCVRVRDAAPNRRLVIQWNLDDDLPIRVQAIVYEAPAGQSNPIEFTYSMVDSDIDGATAGIEDGRGTGETLSGMLGLTVTSARFTPNLTCTP